MLLIQGFGEIGDLRKLSSRVSCTHGSNTRRDLAGSSAWVATRFYVMRGNDSKVWKGGGEGSVHSNVVAPSPHGLATARRLIQKA